jgi:hypothetical protein
VAKIYPSLDFKSRRLLAGDSSAFSGAVAVSLASKMSRTSFETIRKLRFENTTE